MKRGSVSASTRRKMIALWVPEDLISALDSYVALRDLDRSKVIRAALRDKLSGPRPVVESKETTT
jgi:metal-responsive CopG/Arc/MetJ family transcriptional regulator